ncbi:MAG: hypothetical protein M0Q91_15625 [Methanoregula sp.]|jgi:DnaJ-class molecular chaperone|nr:hypothetical protein [Methanoregula sp.]
MTSKLQHGTKQLIGIGDALYSIHEEKCHMCDGTGKAQKLSGFKETDDCIFCEGTGIRIIWVREE